MLAFRKFYLVVHFFNATITELYLVTPKDTFTLIIYQ